MDSHTPLNGITGSSTHAKTGIVEGVTLPASSHNPSTPSASSYLHYSNFFADTTAKMTPAEAASRRGETDLEILLSLALQSTLLGW